MNLKRLNAIFFTIALYPGCTLPAQVKMQQRFITTALGDIAVYHKPGDQNKTPLIFLHGLFLDHHLWDFYVNSIKDRSVYTIDMPMHGKSTAHISNTWNLEDCKTMLIALLDSLNLKKVHAIGHSWGSMTILRAATSFPERFERITLFNTPFQAYGKKQVRLMKLQQLGLLFKNTFIRKTAKTIYAPESLRSNPGLLSYLKNCMKAMPNRAIRHAINAVRIQAEDKSYAFNTLKMAHRVIVAEKDNIAPAPESTKVIMVKGGHTTPLEVPQKSLEIIMGDLK